MEITNLIIIIGLVVCCAILAAFSFSKVFKTTNRMYKVNIFISTIIISLIVLYICNDLLLYLNELLFFNETIFKYIIVFTLIFSVLILLLINLGSRLRAFNLSCIMLLVIFTTSLMLVQPKLGTKSINVNSPCNTSLDISFTLDNIYRVNGVGPWLVYFYSSTSFEEIKGAFKEQVGFTNENSNSITYVFTENEQEYRLTLVNSYEKKTFVLNGFVEAYKYEVLLACL